VETKEKLGYTAEILTDVAILAGITSDLIRSKRSSIHAAECRRHAARVAAATGVAVAFGLVAVRSSAKLRHAAREHHEWKLKDARLEATLEDSGNSSEASASY
jgi:hypothetical protein